MPLYLILPPIGFSAPYVPCSFRYHPLNTVSGDSDPHSRGLSIKFILLECPSIVVIVVTVTRRSVGGCAQTARAIRRRNLQTRAQDKNMQVVDKKHGDKNPSRMLTGVRAISGNSIRSSPPVFGTVSFFLRNESFVRRSRWITTAPFDHSIDRVGGW
jgi:hypothetical protein